MNLQKNETSSNDGLEEQTENIRDIENEDKIQQPPIVDEEAARESDAEDNRIVLNLSYSSYPIIEEVARQKFNYRVSRLPNSEWDILWSDTVVFG